MFWHSFWPSLWDILWIHMAFFLTFCVSYFQAYLLAVEVRRCPPCSEAPRLRSGAAHSARELPVEDVEAKRCPMRCIAGEDDCEKRKKKRNKKKEMTCIKPNNPHLTSREKFVAVVLCIVFSPCASLRHQCQLVCYCQNICCKVWVFIRVLVLLFFISQIACTAVCFCPKHLAGRWRIESSCPGSC